MCSVKATIKGMFSFNHKQVTNYVRKVTTNLSLLVTELFCE